MKTAKMPRGPTVLPFPKKVSAVDEFKESVRVNPVEVQKAKVGLSRNTKCILLQIHMINTPIQYQYLTPAPCSLERARRTVSPSLGLVMLVAVAAFSWWAL